MISSKKVFSHDAQGNALNAVQGNDGIYRQQTICTPSANSIDIFGRQKVADPYKLFEYSASMYYDTTRYWSESTSGSGTVARNATTTQFELALTTASGDEAIMQTRRNIQYNKGNSQEIFIIARPCPVANRLTEFGYGDSSNGIFWQFNGLTPQLIIRTDTSGSPVEVLIVRSAWLDPLDGTGPSGKTANFDKQLVFHFDFGWLSSRGVRFFVDVEGEIINIYNYFISGTLEFPFMRTGNLPMHFRVKNTAAAAASTFFWSCCAVQSSGSEVQEGAVRSVSTGTTPISVSTTPVLGAGVRLSSSFLNGSLQPLDFKMLPISGNTNVYFRVIYNPTIVGATTTALSGIAEGLNTYTSYSGGSVINEGYFPLANKVTGAITALRELLNDIYVGRDLSGSRDWLVIEFRTDSSTGTVLFEGSYKEFA